MCLEIFGNFMPVAFFADLVREKIATNYVFL